MFHSPHLKNSKALDFVGHRDQHLLMSVSSDAMPMHVPVMYW